MVLRRTRDAVSARISRFDSGSGRLRIMFINKNMHTKTMNRAIIVFILALLIIPSVYAATTTIKVTTEPNKFVMIRIFEANSRTNLIESIFDRRVDFNNQVTVTHNSEFSKLDIEVYIKERPNSATQYFQKYPGINAGGTFEATLPEGAGAPSPTTEPPINVTNSTNQTAPSNETNSTNLTAPGVSAGITGNAIQGSTILAKVKWYYIVAGALLAIVLVMGGIAIKERRSKTKPAAIPKSPPGSAKDPNELETKLKETERRLEQATREISRIKNEEQIRDIQKRIDAEQEQIRRLRQGFA